MVSQEDVDWADSCLIEEPDTSDSGWNLNSFRDALLETRIPQNKSPPCEKDVSTERPKNTKLFSEVNTIDGRNLVKTAIDNNTTATSTEAEQPKNDDSSNPENADDEFWSSHKIEDIFLPTYNESLRDIGVSDPEADFVFQEFELEQSTKEIFKIWDLDVPHDEDDGIIKQLNKALDGDPLDPIYSGDDSKAWREMMDNKELDDLISGLADLALSPDSH